MTTYTSRRGDRALLSPVCLFAPLALALLLAATAARADNSTITFTTVFDPTSSLRNQEQLCADLGGTLSADESPAIHLSLVESVRKTKATGAYVAYLGGSTLYAPGCPLPDEKQASLNCVWSWTTGRFAMEQRQPFYMGNAAATKLMGAGPVNNQSLYWAQSDAGVAAFPGDKFLMNMVLASYDAKVPVTDSWVDSADAGGLAYQTKEKNEGRDSFFAICRFDTAVGTDVPEFPSTGAPWQPGSSGSGGNRSNKNQVGMWVGIALGIAAVLVLLIVLCCCRHRIRDRCCADKDEPEEADAQGPTAPQDRRESATVPVPYGATKVRSGEGLP